MSSIQASPNRNTPPSNVRPSDSQSNDPRLVPVEVAPDTFWVGKRMEKLPVGLDIMDEAQDRSHLQAWNVVLDRVLPLARGYLGHSVDEKLMGSTELAETAKVRNGQVSIQRLGRWTVEHVVELLCHGEPPEIAGPIMMEPTTAAAEYNLPTPHLQRVAARRLRPGEGRGGCRDGRGARQRGGVPESRGGGGGAAASRGTEASRE